MVSHFGVSDKLFFSEDYDKKCFESANAIC